MTEKHIYPVSLLVHWKVGEKEPWCLATNLPDREMTLRAYSRWMWFEEMFGDMKKHGFDLESTMLRHADRLSRLTLAVALLYVWLISTGTRVIRDGLRYLVDRHKRHDLVSFKLASASLIVNFFILSRSTFRYVPTFDSSNCQVTRICCGNGAGNGKN